MRHATYYAYGIRIPYTHPDNFEGVLRALRAEGGRIDYLLASDMAFLVTECVEMEPGEFKVITPRSFERPERAAWDRTLHEAAALLGLAESPEPGWILVPDLS
ncbi:hypothetical protein [Streptomyces sp. NEAU-174]|uniref:hypothetical protein n=1 Tax=Streptomyces sp. NEAU-174 TaxID=3458254 RepID=UPI004043F592